MPEGGGGRFSFLLALAGLAGVAVEGPAEDEEAAESVEGAGADWEVADLESEGEIFCCSWGQNKGFCYFLKD